MSVQNRIDKASLFTSITGLLRGQSVETLYKVSWILAMKREGSITLQHLVWEREPDVFGLLEDMVQITPGKLLPKGLSGYYSVAPSVTIAIHELVDLVRDLKVIEVLKEDDA